MASQYCGTHTAACVIKGEDFSTGTTRTGRQQAAVQMYNARPTYPVPHVAVDLRVLVQHHLGRQRPHLHNTCMYVYTCTKASNGQPTQTHPPITGPSCAMGPPKLLIPYPVRARGGAALAPLPIGLLRRLARVQVEVDALLVLLHLRLHVV